MKKWIALACLLLCAACARAEGRTLERFWYRRAGDTMPETWLICREGDAFWLEENGEAPRKIDAAWVAELQEVIEKYDLLSWDGFSGSDPDVLDGESFSLEIAFSDGAAAQASGENEFPKGYFPAKSEFLDVLTREQRASLAGIYRWADGDAAITLDADGGFTCGKETAGIWYANMGSIDLYGQGDTDGSWFFYQEEGALVFFASASDPFPGADVPDEARFVRAEP